MGFFFFDLVLFSYFLMNELVERELVILLCMVFDDLS